MANSISKLPCGSPAALPSRGTCQRPQPLLPAAEASLPGCSHMSWPAFKKLLGSLIKTLEPWIFIDILSTSMSHFKLQVCLAECGSTGRAAETRGGAGPGGSPWVSWRLWCLTGGPVTPMSPAHRPVGREGAEISGCRMGAGSQRPHGRTD